MRTARIARKTNETDITLTICLDGRGVSAIQSGVGFLDHMLTLLARHGRLDLELTCRGDTAGSVYIRVVFCGRTQVADGLQ